MMAKDYKKYGDRKSKATARAEELARADAVTHPKSRKTKKEPGIKVRVDHAEQLLRKATECVHSMVDLLGRMHPEIKGTAQYKDLCGGGHPHWALKHTLTDSKRVIDATPAMLEVLRVWCEEQGDKSHGHP